MASHTSKAFLSLGRINVPCFGLQGSVSRVTYATALTINSPPGNKGLPERGGRGAFGRKPRRDAGQPRTDKMPVNQDWTAVYPAATPFRANSVPLPVRMGYPVRGGVPPEKKGNLELIKIPNFLHLTPAAIKKHCEALKPFCTEWPSALDTDAKCDQHFPVKVESTDYVSAGLSVRNPSARIVHLRIKLSSLNLDDHARKKMLKLVGERYCKDTDILTIITDSCPLRQQNYDYAMYLLTVLYHESWTGCYADQMRMAVMTVINLKHLEISRAEALSLPRYKLLHSEVYCSQGNVMIARQAADIRLHMEKYYLCERSIKEGKTEAWEAEKTVADMEEYSWEGSPSQKNILDTLVRMKVAGEEEGEEVREQLLGRREVQEYKDSVTRLKNEGESESTMLQYKEAVKKVFNL